MHFETLDQRVFLSVSVHANAATAAAAPTSTFDAKHPLKLTTDTGNRLTLTLKGPGQGTLDATSDVGSLTLSGTTAASALTIKTTKPFTVGTWNDDGPLGSLTATTTDIYNLYLTGASQVSVADLKGTIDMSGTTRPVRFSAKAITATRMDMQSVDFSSFKATRIVSASGIFGTTNFDLHSASTFQVTDTIVGTRIRAGQQLGRVTVGGKMQRSSFLSAGPITSVTAGSMTQSTIAAGTTDSVPWPLANPAAALGTVTLKSRAADAFLDSHVYAGSIRSASLGAVRSSNTNVDIDHVFAATRIGTLTFSTADHPRAKFVRPTAQTLSAFEDTNIRVQITGA